MFILAPTGEQKLHRFTIIHVVQILELIRQGQEVLITLTVRPRQGEAHQCPQEPLHVVPLRPEAVVLPTEVQVQAADLPEAEEAVVNL